MNVPISKIRKMRLAMDIDQDEVDPKYLISPCFSGQECDHESYGAHKEE